MEKGGFIYIMTNKNHTVFYTGVTSNLIIRVQKHKEGIDTRSYTFKYNVYKLIYYEEFASIEEAIGREKQIKAGSRLKKINLINRMNPGWVDLYELIAGF
jgi:putative endonuclease